MCTFHAAAIHFDKKNKFRYTISQPTFYNPGEMMVKLIALVIRLSDNSLFLFPSRLQFHRFLAKLQESLGIEADVARIFIAFSL